MGEAEESGRLAGVATSKANFRVNGRGRRGECRRDTSTTPVMLRVVCGYFAREQERCGVPGLLQFKGEMDRHREGILGRCPIRDAVYQVRRSSQEINAVCTIVQWCVLYDA